jgi:hypothetical protein
MTLNKCIIINNEAGKFISAGFEAKAGTVFLSQIGGYCNN